MKITVTFDEVSVKFRIDLKRSTFIEFLDEVAVTFGIDVPHLKVYFHYREADELRRVRDDDDWEEFLSYCAITSLKVNVFVKASRRHRDPDSAEVEQALADAYDEAFDEYQRAVAEEEEELEAAEARRKRHRRRSHEDDFDVVDFDRRGDRVKRRRYDVLERADELANLSSSESSSESTTSESISSSSSSSSSSEDSDDIVVHDPRGVHYGDEESSSEDDYSYHHLFADESSSSDASSSDSSSDSDDEEITSPSTTSESDSDEDDAEVVEFDQFGEPITATTPTAHVIIRVPSGDAREEDELVTLGPIAVSEDMVADAINQHAANREVELDYDDSSESSTSESSMDESSTSESSTSESSTSESSMSESSMSESSTSESSSSEDYPSDDLD